MCRTRVKKGNQCASTDLDKEPHGLAQSWLNTNEHRKRNLQLTASLWIIIVAINVLLHFNDEATLTPVAENELLFTLIAQTLGTVPVELGQGQCATW